MFSFDVRTGQYRDSNTGRFVKRTKIETLLNKEVNRTQTVLNGLVNSYFAGRISPDEFRDKYKKEIKNASIRHAALGAGGITGMDKKNYGFIGFYYSEINQRVDRAINDNISKKQWLQRSNLYAQSTKGAFYWSDRKSQIMAGKTQAKRTLDPTAIHCSECVSLQRNEWTPIEQITPIGVGCSCRGRCRCRISYRAYID
jgi:hypothetical protein